MLWQYISLQATDRANIDCGDGSQPYFIMTTIFVPRKSSVVEMTHTLAEWHTHAHFLGEGFGSRANYRGEYIG